MDKAAAKDRYRPLFNLSQNEFLAKLDALGEPPSRPISYDCFAEYLRATKGTVARWAHEGMPTVRESGSVRIDPVAALKWLRDNPKRPCSIGRESWVYFAQHPDGRVKIGMTSDVARRMDELSKGLKVNGDRVELLGSVRGSKARELELHAMFDELRIDPSAEWFRPGVELMQFIEQHRD